MPLISVIVPVYNVERYLCRCVNSILSQTFSDFELILVDDGSSDKSGNICDRFSETDSRVCVLHQANRGAAIARNSGLDYVFEHSDSQWITFIDSDDWVHENYLSNLFTAVSENHLEIAICKIRRVSNEIPDSNDTVLLQYYSPDDFWADDAITAASPCAKLYAKSLFKDLRFPPDKHCEDMFILYKILFMFETLAVLTPSLYYYFYNLDSTSNNLSLSQRMDYIEALTEQCEFFKKNNYHRAGTTAAFTLFYEIVNDINCLKTQDPFEKHTIQFLRRKLRKVRWRYRKCLVLTDGNGKKTYTQLAHPFYYKLKKKCKHLFRFFTKKN